MKKYGVIALVIGIVALFVYVRWLQAERTRLLLERDVAITNLTAVKAKTALDKTIIKQAHDHHEKISNTPKDQDGPVAPVLRDTLLGLR